MSNKTDLQRNNVILGGTPNGLLGGLSKTEYALEDKGVDVVKKGTYPTFNELKEAIEKGVIDTRDADATEGDIAKGKTAYVKGEKLTGTGNIEKEIEGVNILDLPFKIKSIGDMTQYLRFIQNNIEDLFFYYNTSDYGLYYLNKETKSIDIILDKIGYDSQIDFNYYVFDNNDILIMTGIPIYFNALTKQTTQIAGLGASSTRVLYSAMYNDNIYVFFNYYLYKFNKTNMVFEKVSDSRYSQYIKIFGTPDGLFFTQNYSGSLHTKYLGKLNEQTNTIDQLYTGKTYNFNQCTYMENFGTFFYSNSDDTTTEGVSNGFFKYIKSSNTIQPISDVSTGFRGFTNYIIDKNGDMFFTGHYGWNVSGLFYLKKNNDKAIQLNPDEFTNYGGFIYLKFLNIDDDLIIYKFEGSASDSLKGVWKFDYKQEKFVQLTGLENAYKLVQGEVNGNYYFIASASGLGDGIYTYDKTAKNLIKVIDTTAYSSNLFAYYVDGFGTFITTTGIYYKQDNTDNFIQLSTSDMGITNFCKSTTEDILYIKTGYYGSIKYLKGTTYGTCGTTSFTIGEYAQMIEYGNYIIYCRYSSKSAAAIYYEYGAMRADENTISVFKKSDTTEGKLTQIGSDIRINPSTRAYLEVIDEKLMLRNWDINGDYEIILNDNQPYFKHLGWGSNKEQAINDIVVCSYNISGSSNGLSNSVFAYAKNENVKITQTIAYACYDDGRITKTIGNSQNVYAITSKYWIIKNVFEGSVWQLAYIS